MKIAISKGTANDKKYGRYAPWLAAAGRGVDCVDLSSLGHEEALQALKDADGIVFTGGPDVDPARYGRPDAITQCGPLDKERDAQECAWFEIAAERGIPMLGICRGLQLANVMLGGTLYPDFRSVFPDALAHKDSSERDAIHTVTLTAGTLLGLKGGEANSAHHQCVDRVAPLLQVTAQSPDGIIEAIEWREPGGNPFFLGVQWHPERLAAENPLSDAVARTFLDSLRAY